MNRMPEVVTHNYDPRRGLCRNICALPIAEARAILDEIAVSGGRSFKADYLHRRLKVEDWLMSERQRKLGPTRLARPAYFFLGDFADGRDPSRPASLVLPLAAFPPETLTFTYPDSMASLAIATLDGHRPNRKPYHGQVFTLAEIRDVVARHGMPGERWQSDAAMEYDRFIEVQVWDDSPIRRVLAPAGSR